MYALNLSEQNYIINKVDIMTYSIQ